MVFTYFIIHIFSTLLEFTTKWLGVIAYSPCTQERRRIERTAAELEQAGARVAGGAARGQLQRVRQTALATEVSAKQEKHQTMRIQQSASRCLGRGLLKAGLMHSTLISQPEG